MNTQGTGLHDASDSRPNLIAGSSESTQELLRRIDKVADGTYPVLILGETGTGKEVAARAIYQQRSVGAFVTIDCSSLVGSLLETELFGHAKGAFTGAAAAKAGLIELANGGTAFFDEIGELPLDLQAKLLRVLQEKEYRPVGGLGTRKSEFRVIAATNRELNREVERGTFRRDLYYRLNVVTIRLTPLRERKGDIHDLVARFLGKYGKGHQVTPELMTVLTDYDWPGNVRELENCIQQMAAVNSGPLLHIDDLPSPVQNFRRQRNMIAMAAAVSSGNMPASVASPAAAGCPIVPLLTLERQMIRRALEYTNGDRGYAAYLLGIGRTTLYRKLKEIAASEEVEQR